MNKLLETAPAKYGINTFAISTGWTTIVAPVAAIEAVIISETTDDAVTTWNDAFDLLISAICFMSGPVLIWLASSARKLYPVG